MPRRPRGRVDVQLCSSFNHGTRQAWLVNATPRPLYPRERRGTHCIVGWVGHRAVLYGCGKSRPPPPPPGIRSPDRPARIESLYRLGNRGPFCKENAFDDISKCPSVFCSSHWEFQNQFGRVCYIIVSNSDLQSLRYSERHCRFPVAYFLHLRIPSVSKLSRLRAERPRFFLGFVSLQGAQIILFFTISHNRSGSQRTSCSMYIQRCYLEIQRPGVNLMTLLSR